MTESDDKAKSERQASEERAARLRHEAEKVLHGEAQHVKDDMRLSPRDAIRERMRELSNRRKEEQQLDEPEPNH